MSEDPHGEVKADIAELRRGAARLREGAEELRRRRLGGALWRLAYGRGDRPTDKARDNVKVTIGAIAFEHQGTRTGELVAARVKSCDDSFNAAEDGLRALSTVMTRVAAALETRDELNECELKAMMEDL